jgi:hypothetical protein
MKTLNKEIGSGGQSVTYKETLEHNGKKLRISIKSDSYRAQCYARVLLFDGDKWNQIDSIHYSRMVTEAKLIYRPNVLPNDSDFKADRDRLVKLAKDVLD